jgi:5-methylcytosine-specific restriction endonuclease McrA
MDPQDIFFDEDDQNLFQVDDIQLKAEALRHSVLPKLQAACNHLVHLIRDVYEVEVLEDSSFTLSPHFRTHGRIVELKKNYTDASIEISGQRKEGKWPGLAKPDGKPVTIVPFGMSFQLDSSGIDTSVYVARPTYTKDTFKKFFDFAHKYEGEIMAILHRARFNYWTHLCMDHLPPISSLSEILHWSYDNDVNKIYFTGEHSEYPLDNGKVVRKLIDLVFAFPIYDSFLQISKGEPERFPSLLEKLNATIWDMDVDQLVEEYQKSLAVKENDEALIEQARESAGKRIRVMPSMRWQVFQRDNWKCVACGKCANDDIWLEVDHILPRSKGGKNEIGNYQTLCNVCNIGKSNKNDTDIRSLRKTMKP